MKSTKDIKVSSKIYEQIIGQNKALEIVKKAAKQRRNLLLIGDPGTGKSLLGHALAELLPTEKLVDVLSYDNPIDENTPIIKTVPRGEGKEIVSKARLQAITSFKKQSTFIFILVILSMITPWLIRKQYGDIMAAASLIGSMIFLGAFILFLNINRRVKTTSRVPKLLIDNSNTKKVPFLDASGALGDCLHDPLQCLNSSNNIFIIKEIGKDKYILQEEDISLKINNLLEKNKDKIIKRKDYSAVHLKEGELKILGERNKNIQDVTVLSVNKHKNHHKYLIKLTTETGKELIVTSEHKIAVKDFFNKIKYIAAENLKPWHKLITLE